MLLKINNNIKNLLINIYSMTNIKLIGLCTILALGFSNCEETAIRTFEENIFIITDQNLYQNAEQINVSIKNNFSEEANHFICDGVDLVYDYILTETTEGWTEQDRITWCTFMGPVGYYGTLGSLETKYDSLIINEPGTYKLTYSFILNSDTLYYLSNEFDVIE